MQKYIILFIALFPIVSLSAQFGGIMNKAKQKLNQKIEDKIADKIAEEIANRAFRPIEASMDSLLKQKYENESGERVNWDSVSIAYTEYLHNLNKNVDLPVQYTFDYSHEILIKDENGDKNNLVMLYSENGDYIGIETTNAEKGNNIVVLDIAKDLMILYSVKGDGHKSGQVLPSFNGLISKMAASNSIGETNIEYKISKTGKTKKISGFVSEEYKIETNDDEGTIYLSKETPIDWKNTYDGFMQKMGPQNFTKPHQNEAQGLLMEYETYPKENRKKVTKWSTVKFESKVTSLINKEYGLIK